MKKVAFITTVPILTPRQELQIRALKEAEYQIKVISLDRNGTQLPEETLGDVSFLRIQGSYKNNLIIQNSNQSQTSYWGETKDKNSKVIAQLSMLLLRLLGRLLHDNADIICCTHPFLLPIALTVKKKKGTKIVYEIAEFHTDNMLNWFPKRFQPPRKLIESLENAIVRHVDGVTCVPDKGHKLYQRFVKSCRNIDILMNVPEAGEYVDEALLSDLKRQYSDKNIIVYGGGLRINKGILEVAKAIKIVKEKFPNVMLMLIGSSYGDDSGEIARFAEINGISANVDLIELQPYRKLHTFYSMARIGLNLPILALSTYEHNLTIGNSRKNSDYMKASLPIIVPNSGEMGLQIKQENCGLVINAFDSDNLADAVIYLLENRVEAEQMGRNGYKAFLNKYNWDSEKGKLLRVYKSLS